MSGTNKLVQSNNAKNKESISALNSALMNANNSAIGSTKTKKNAKKGK